VTDGLEVAGLTAHYRLGPAVVHDVTLHAPRGCITALLGVNGSGKSTVIKALAGLVPYEGHVALDGTKLAALAPKVRARRLAYVPQRTAMRAPVRVRDMVELGRFAHRGALDPGTKHDELAIERALAEVDASALADRRFTELSGGEQQRVLLARALATGATALLLDEPTSALDVRQRLVFHALLRRLAADGCCVLLVVHDLSEAREHADLGVVLEGGRVCQTGPMPQVLAAPRVRAAYGVEILEGAGLGYRLPGAPAGAVP